VAIGIDHTNNYQCCSPRGKSLSSRILEVQFTSPCPWTTKSLQIFKDFAFCKLSVMYDHVTSINSVITTVHEATVKNGLLTEYRCQLQVYVNVSLRTRYFLFLWQINYQLLSSLHTHLSPCPCPPGLRTSSPCPCPRAISP